MSDYELESGIVVKSRAKGRRLYASAHPCAISSRVREAKGKTTGEKVEPGGRWSVEGASKSLFFAETVLVNREETNASVILAKILIHAIIHFSLRTVSRRKKRWLRTDV